jgi:O-antigen/teichoic acid export membrane protein
MMVKETTILRVSSLLVSGCVGIFLAVKGMVYWSLAWQQFTYIAMTSIWRFFIIKWRPSMHIDFAPIKRMFSFSYKILITTIVNQLSQNLLTLVFGRLFTAKNVGNFTQAFKWDTMASSFVSGTVAQVAQPVLVEINDDSERQVNVFRKMLRFTAFLAFPAMFGLALIAHEFIIITISEKWIDSIPLLRILCISGAFLPFYTMYQNLVISKERSDIYMWCTIGLIAVQFILVLLTYSYGMVFMVTVYSASVILWLFVWQYYAKRLIGLKLLDAIKDILPFALISAAIMIACYYITLPIANLKLLLATRIVMAAIMYVAVMKILKVKMLDECINFIRKKKV